MPNDQILIKECIRHGYNDSEIFSNENDYFEFFSSSQLLKNYNLTDEEIMDGITDGGNDGGCDAIYLFLNDLLVSTDQIANLTASRNSTLEFIIIQAKNTCSFKEDAIMKFKTVSDNLLNLSVTENDFSDRYNAVVREKFQLFKDSVRKLITSQIKIKIKYYYATLSDELHPNVQHQGDELLEIARKHFPSCKASIDYIGAKELINLYNTPEDICLPIDLADTPITLGNPISYIALVNIADYYTFITNENGTIRNSLFESNVRDYQGKNMVNTAIANTLCDDGKENEDFWLFNNGVTVLSEQITPVTSKKIQISNPEIVNGLQTSTEIYNYYSMHRDSLEHEHRNILVRFIVPENEELRDKIIFATNNQTNIPNSSLRATDNIHLQIELYFRPRGLYYDRRKNHYKNLKKRSVDIVSISFLAQCMISIILQKPDMARARPSTLLMDDETYNYLYNESLSLEVYYKAARIGKIVQKRLMSYTMLESSEKNDILFYIIYAVVAAALRKRQISFDDLAGFNVDEITDEKIDKLKAIIYNKYCELGRSSQVAKNPSFFNEVCDLIGV